MSPILAFFALRLLLALLLYSFLGALLWMLWQDVRYTARVSATRSRRMGRLVILESPLPALTPGAAFPLLPVTSLGRAVTNTAPIPDEAVSLEHALLHLREGQWWLEDLDSRNGTRLNETTVTQATLVMPGDVISLGHIRLTMELE
jgi:hypothetical protein